MTLQTKSIQILAQWRWRVRHRILAALKLYGASYVFATVIAKSHMCHGSATAASRSLQERSERGRISYEMSWPVPETGDFVPCPRHASFGSLMKAKKKKKKKIGRYDLNCNSTSCKVGLTSMLRNCVSFFLCYARTLACCTCSYTVRKLLPSRTFPGLHSPAPS